MNKGWATYQSLTLSSNFTKDIMGLIVDNQRHFSLTLKNFFKFLITYLGDMDKGWGTYQSLTLSSNLTKVIMRLIVNNQRHFSLTSYVEMQIQQINNK
jgi:hypothetical protein